MCQYSLRSLLFLSYSLRSTSLIPYWLMVTVCPPMASLITTRALSGSTPSICEACSTNTLRGMQVKPMSHELTGSGLLLQAPVCCYNIKFGVLQHESTHEHEGSSEWVNSSDKTLRCMRTNSCDSVGQEGGLVFSLGNASIVHGLPLWRGWPSTWCVPST